MADASPAAFEPLPGARPDCDLCSAAGGRLILQSPLWRVVRVEDADFPAFYRLIWNEHHAEFSDLSEDERVRCMRAVAAVERVLRERLAPTKLNLASLGNMVPHLHWHLIARFDWDSHFPQPIWGTRQRDVAGGSEGRLACGLGELDQAVLEGLAPLAASG